MSILDSESLSIYFLCEMPLSDTPDLRGFASPTMLAVEDALVVISELSGRISASPVRGAWFRRAAWSGYARAVQLQGGEIDEIDVFSWGAGVPVPGRPRRHTHDGEFEPFDLWWEKLHRFDRDAWRDALPFTPDVDRSVPRILQAIDLTRQYARRTGGIDAWLEMPRFLFQLGVASTPLPCLVAGAKAFRLQSRLTDDQVRSTLKGLSAAGKQGLVMVDMMEAGYREAVRAVRSEYRPGKLPELLALSLALGVLSPASVVKHLALSIAGAGRLLDRATEIGLVVEITGRRSWKAYVEPQLAIALGFRKSPLGRPRKEAPAIAPRLELEALFADFDREMAAINERLNGIPTSD